MFLLLSRHPEGDTHSAFSPPTPLLTPSTSVLPGLCLTLLHSVFILCYIWFPVPFLFPPAQTTLQLAQALSLVAPLWGQVWDRLEAQLCP